MVIKQHAIQLKMPSVFKIVRYRERGSFPFVLTEGKILDALSSNQSLGSHRLDLLAPLCLCLFLFISAMQPRIRITGQVTAVIVGV